MIEDKNRFEKGQLSSLLFPEDWTMVNQWWIKINEDELKRDFAQMNEDAWRWIMPTRNDWRWRRM